MNKVGKFIKKCDPKDRNILIDIFEKISKNDLANLDLKKLKGYDNYFRIRKGDLRIIFHLDKSGSPIIQYISKRDDNTYNI